MKVFTDKQHTKILGRIMYLKKELGVPYFNNLLGEALMKAVLEIERLILEGDEIKVVTQK